jgi:hypothetical protein
MPLLPYTRQPVADQWDINHWMKTLLKKRYSNHAMAKAPTVQFVIPDKA